MWIFTTVGFFSTVIDKHRPRDVVVRARLRGDLERLRAQALPTLSPTEEGSGSDYRYRARCTRSAWSNALAAIGAAVSYENFKVAVAHLDGLEREALYEDVWRVMRNAEAQTQPGVAQPSSPRRQRLGRRRL